MGNIYADKPGGWVCVNVSDVVASNPDVLVIVDAAWDTAISKIKWLYDDAGFCQLEVLRAARFISIPFSATTLSPRNGPAALDLAVAALHVRTGSQTAVQKSGVGSFSPYFLQSETGCSRCPLVTSYVIYDDENDSPNNYRMCTTTTTTVTATPSVKSEDVSTAFCVSLGLWWWTAVGGVSIMRSLS